MAYRSAIHESTGRTPKQLMFERDVILPEDLMFGTPPVTVTQPNYTEYVWNLMEQIDHLNIASQRQKRLYDHRSHANSYREGEKV